MNEAPYAGPSSSWQDLDFTHNGKLEDSRIVVVQKWLDKGEIDANKRVK